jgi:peptidoglycan/xylan/chitin deacetylase (PgdA/CDA1 family)
VDAICAHVARYFEPVSLAAIEAAISGGPGLPDNAVAVTVDDGYRNFLLYGHPIFRRHNIPVSLFAVAGFSDGQLWLWPDQVRFALEQTCRTNLRAELTSDVTLNLDLSSANAKSVAWESLTQAMIGIPNELRVRFLAGLGALCAVEIPRTPPAGREAMGWDDLRAVASEGTDIGCHTYTHPILSRIASATQLEKETLGARQLMEERLGFRVNRFCYPNGTPADISGEAIDWVRKAGFTSAVCCTWGLNRNRIDRFQLRRVPFDADIDLRYGIELLCGLHM